MLYTKEVSLVLDISAIMLPSVLHGCGGVWGPEQLETCIYLRAAKGRGGLAFSYLSLSSCLIGWFGISAVSRRGWEKAIKSRSFPFRARYQQRWMHAFCELTLQFSISQLGPHTPVADSTGEFFWGIMAGSQFKPDLSASHPQVHVATQDWLPLSFSTGLHLIAKGDSWKASDPWHSVIYIMS